MKYAILVDGTGAYEAAVYTVEADNETDALTKVAEEIIKQEQEAGCAAASHSEASTNNGTPVSTMEIYNDEGDLVYDMKVLPLTEF